MYVSDDALLEIFETTDLDVASAAFIKSLPHASIKDILNGDSPPPLQRPRYVRILCFLCWMQTSSTRETGEREFREMLERRLGISFNGNTLCGLDKLWLHLQAYLEREHDIELVLPDVVPAFRRIGRTLQLAFPTWRNKETLRQVRDQLSETDLFDPLRISNILTTYAIRGSESMQSFVYNFGQFELARKRGSGEFENTLFWQAWYAVVAETKALENLEVTNGEFGEVELFRVSPIGGRVAISTPEEAKRFVPKKLANAIERGWLMLESLGFGRFRATTLSKTHILLIRRSNMKELPQSAFRSVRDLNARWVLADFRKLDDDDIVTSNAREFAWRDGIKVGGSWLGRTPLAPWIESPYQSVRVEIDGENVSTRREERGFSLPDGIYSGTAVAFSQGEHREYRLVPRAIEIADAGRLDFNPAKHISEDEFHHATIPSLDRTFEPWLGQRSPACEELITIGEALYARSARGISLGEAFGIVSRGVAKIEPRPSPWDVLRAFGDAGWFDFVLIRNFPARLMLQRAATAEEQSGNVVRILGPVPLVLIDRLSVAAHHVGGVIEAYDGCSPWSLPRYAVKLPDRPAVLEFLSRAKLGAPVNQSLADIGQGDDSGVHGYRAVARFDEEKGVFDQHSGRDLEGGLYRLQRAGEKTRFLYRSIVQGETPRNFDSPTAAVLAHHARRRRVQFELDEFQIVSSAPSAFLPACWARWASDRVLCNAGPQYHIDRWRYGYPVGAQAILALSKLVSIKQNGGAGTPWVGRFLASAANRNRAVFDVRSRSIRAGINLPRKSR